MRAAIPFVLISICLLTSTNWYLWRRASENSAFTKVVGYANIYLGCHGLYVLIVELFFNETRFPDRAPFSLFYGPLVYFASISNPANSLSRLKVMLHSTPFVTFATWFTFLLIYDATLSSQQIYSSTLSRVGMLSFAGYVIWACIYNGRYLGSRFKQRKLMILAAMLLLLFMFMISVAVILARDVLSKGETGTLIRLMVYSCMLAAAALIFRYNIHLLLTKKPGKQVVGAEVFKSATDVIPEIKYEKSPLTAGQLEQYAQQLLTLMDSGQVYLQPDLSLKKLAKLMQTPAHHLTQVLNVEVKMSFYEYLNGFRVRYACELMKQNPNSTLELIAQLSGFNSKASFNRQFKSIMGCTPSEYRQGTGTD